MRGWLLLALAMAFILAEDAEGFLNSVALRLRPAREGEAFVRNIAACLLFLRLAAESAAGEPLHAGVARVDLTPPLALKPTLGGYSARMARPAEGVHDRVWAKALFLTDGKTKHVTVTADVLGFPHTFKPALMAKLKERNIGTDEVLLLASHSHNSLGIMDLNPDNVFGVPQIGVFNPKVLDHALAKIADAIEEASKRQAEVKLGTASRTLEGFARNRRGVGATLPLLTVTRLDRADDGKPFAVLVHWAAHPTFLGPKDMAFSGDWPGHLQRTLEALIGDGVVVMYLNGAQGDQSPTPRLRGNVSGHEQAEAYGRDLALRTWKQWQDLRPEPNARLAFRIEEFSLPPKARHKDFMKEGGWLGGFLEKGLDGMLAKLLPEKSHCHILRLGGLALVGVPGELTAGLGVELRQKALAATGAETAVVGGLADEWISYMLTEEEYARGGYEATVSFYGPKLGPTVVEAAVKGAGRVK